MQDPQLLHLATKLAWQLNLPHISLQRVRVIDARIQPTEDDTNGALPNLPRPSRVAGMCDKVHFYHLPKSSQQYGLRAFLVYHSLFYHFPASPQPLHSLSAVQHLRRAVRRLRFIKMEVRLHYACVGFNMVLLGHSHFWSPYRYEKGRDPAICCDHTIADQWC
jgi:hypothetical protein